MFTSKIIQLLNILICEHLLLIIEFKDTLLAVLDGKRWRLMSIKVQLIFSLQLRCNQNVRWTLFWLLWLKLRYFILWRRLGIYRKHVLLFFKQIRFCKFLAVFCRATIE